MSKYDGCYVKVSGDATYYAIDNGKKVQVANAEEMYRIGLRPVHVISQAALNSIPFLSAGEDEEE